MRFVTNGKAVCLNRRVIPSLFVGFTLSCAIACALAKPVAADAHLEFIETSWSVRSQPPQQSTSLRTWVSGGKRRIETETLPDSESTRPHTFFVQIDRRDLDSSYVVLPGDSLYGSVPFERSRAANRTSLEEARAARAAGTAPPDTLPKVRITPLPKSARKIFGITCPAYEIELRFTYKDSIPGGGGLRTEGVLTDTLWLAPPDSPLGDLQRFEREFAHVTLSDSLLAGLNAVELSQSRGQGVISVLRREERKLPGFPIAAHYRNVIYGLPKGLSGVERTRDGAVIVQRSVREPTLVELSPIDPSVFEVPAGYRRDVAGEARNASGTAPGSAPGK